MDGDRPAQAAVGPPRRQERRPGCHPGRPRSPARDHLTTPRQRGHREALRVLHTTRTAIVAAGADARRQPRGPDRHRPPSRCGTGYGGGPGASRLVPAPGWWPCPAIRWSTGPPCARWAGPLSWSHPGRFRSEAAFAMLAGAAPGGGVLWPGRSPLPQPWWGSAAESDLAHHRDAPPDPSWPTRAYTSRRIAQGKSERERSAGASSAASPASCTDFWSGLLPTSPQSMQTRCIRRPRTRAAPRPEEGS